MRKFKAWSLLFVMALCVMIFSGCGGSYTEDEESSSTTTEDNTTTNDETVTSGDVTTSNDVTTSSDITSTVISTLTGTWQIDNTKGFSGTGSYTKNDTTQSISLSEVAGFTISFSDIELTGSSSDLEGTAKVFYSYESSAYDFNAGVRSYDLGSVSVKNYTSESATDKTTLMRLSQINEQQWILQLTSNLNERITITLDSESKREFRIQWNVSVYIPGLDDTCDCVISCYMIKILIHEAADAGHETPNNQN